MSVNSPQELCNSPQELSISTQTVMKLTTCFSWNLLKVYYEQNFNVKFYAKISFFKSHHTLFLAIIFLNYPSAIFFNFPPKKDFKINFPRFEQIAEGKLFFALERQFSNFSFFLLLLLHVVFMNHLSKKKTRKICKNNF